MLVGGCLVCRPILGARKPHLRRMPKFVSRAIDCYFDPPVAIMRKLEPRIIEDDKPQVLLRGLLELLPYEVQQGRRGREGEVGVLRFRVN